MTVLSSVHVQVPVEEGGGTVQVPVAEEGDVTQGVEKEGAAHVQVPIDEGGGAVPVQVDVGSDVTKNDGGIHVVHAPVDEVQVPVDKGPGVAKDEEGGGVVPIPVDEEAGGLRIMMAKQDCFAHGGEGGITKSAAVRFSFQS